MVKPKEIALTEFHKMILNSWTYSRLTEEEKYRWSRTLEMTNIRNVLKGTYPQRWDTLNMIYYAFLEGVGYKPTGWREPEEAPKF